jgi:hypothetical protein
MIILKVFLVISGNVFLAKLDLGYYLLPRLLVNSRTFENRLHCPFEGWAADWWILPGALTPACRNGFT